MFGIGYFVGKVAKLDIKSISYIALNIFYPFLAFQTFYKNDITADHFYIFVVITILIPLLFILIVMIAKIGKLDKKNKHAMLLAGVFMNGGNYGVPVALFAFGEEGFMYALMTMIVLSIWMNSFGLYWAASGASEQISKKRAIKRVMKMPIMFGVIIGVLFQLIQIRLPVQLEKTITLLSDAAIPCIMIVLGIQLSTIAFREISFKLVGAIVFIRLMISPLIMLGLVYLVGIEGSLLGNVLVIISAMPTAANTTMFAVQFDIIPDLVSATTLISTILSLISLPFWFYIL